MANIEERVESLLESTINNLGYELYDVEYAKEGKDLPVDNNKKISKAEQLEIDTYQFLNKYEYDLIDDLAKTEKYQDTLANEIAMIVDYINSSNVLK